MAPNPTPAEVQARLKHLTAATYRPLVEAGWALIIALVGGGAAMAATFVLTRDVVPVALVGIAALLLYVAAMVWVNRTLRRRQAVELSRDHDCREAKEWKEALGGRSPRGRKGMERWLIEHPDGPGRFMPLLALGRIVEAEAEIGRRPARTPEERFDAELMRLQAATVRGTATDVTSLRELLAAIPDRRRQKARMQCVVTLDAWQAADRGDDPLAVLARGRRDIGLLDRSSHTERWILSTAFLVACWYWIIGCVAFILLTL